MSSRFKPSKKYLNYLMSLPQHKFSDSGLHVPPLFGTVVSWMPALYLLFFALIGIEIWTIFGLHSKGVDPNIMILLVVVEIIVAVLPIIPEGNNSNLNGAFVNAKIFISKLALKHSAPHSTENAKGVEQLKYWEKRKSVINLVKFIVVLLILSIGYWKFHSYYSIFRNSIFILPLGRLVIMSIALGVIVHIFITKTVVINMMKNRLRRIERNEFLEGNGVYVCQDLYEGIRIENSHTQVEFDTSNIEDKIQLYELSDKKNDNSIGITVNSKQWYFDPQVSKSKEVFLLFKCIVEDGNLNKLILQQNDFKSKELVAKIGKEIQLSILSN